jgi:hypothetical protein
MPVGEQHHGGIAVTIVHLAIGEVLARPGFCIAFRRIRGGLSHKYALLGQSMKTGPNLPQ